MLSSVRWKHNSFILYGRACFTHHGDICSADTTELAAGFQVSSLTGNGKDRWVMRLRWFFTSWLKSGATYVGSPKCTVWDWRIIRSLHITLFTEGTGIKRSSGEPVAARGFYTGLLEGWYHPGMDAPVWHFCHLADICTLPHTSPATLAKPPLFPGTISTAWGVITPLYFLRFLFQLSL